MKKQNQDYNIKFNLPFISGKEQDYFSDVLRRKHLAGKGYYTAKCQDFFLEHFGFQNCLLTPSCSDALEMAAILSEVGPEDEVIVPAYTFVTTANAFALRGARIRFADSQIDDPNVGVDQIAACITSKTKVVVLVHYGGYACQIEEIRTLCDKHKLILIEDAACALDSYLGNKALGTFGDLATFSFHETKNITSGKGGLLVINNEKYIDRARVIWEKGTNRAAFFNGEVDKYGWVDLGSSYLNSEIMASFLLAQLEQIDQVKNFRKSQWETYRSALKQVPVEQCSIGSDLSYNYHMYYLVMANQEDRDKVIHDAANKGIQIVFHYQALNESEFSLKTYGEQSCPNAERFSASLIRLPIHKYLEQQDLEKVCQIVISNVAKEALN